MSVRTLALAMGAEAATLVVASALHFAAATGGSRPFRPDDAAIAEAVTAVVLVAGALAVARGSRAAGTGAVSFAILGFLVGLNFTIRGGSAGDLAYHATMLPLLVLTLRALLGRVPRRRSSIGV